MSTKRPTPEGVCITCHAVCTVPYQRCKRCYRSQTPETPLRKWCRQTGRSLEQLAALTGLPLRSVKRTASGVPATTENALAIEKATGIPLEVLLEGEDIA